jgi:hypothetical protein
MIFQGSNPFPDCVCEAEAMLIIGYLVMSIVFMLFLMILMIYFYVKIERFLPVLLIFLFSIVIGMVSFSGSYLPFTPFIQIFFMLFQTIIFYLKIDENDFKNIWR